MEEPTYTGSLEEAARSIIYQYEHREKHGEFDYAADCPSEDNGQTFDGWAADVLEAALATEGKAPFDYDLEHARAHWEID